MDDHVKLTEEHFEFANDYPIFITEKDAVKCTDLKLNNVWVVVLKLAMDPQSKDEVLKMITSEL